MEWEGGVWGGGGAGKVGGGVGGGRGGNETLSLTVAVPIPELQQHMYFAAAKWTLSVRQAQTGCYKICLLFEETTLLFLQLQKR